MGYPFGDMYELSSYIFDDLHFCVEDIGPSFGQYRDIPNHVGDIPHG